MVINIEYLHVITRCFLSNELGLNILSHRKIAFSLHPELDRETVCGAEEKLYAPSFRKKRKKKETKQANKQET